ncbi:MAG: hypothetical protein L6Q97_14500, partial [Thermoanaerobaculia bacterium]|nr:hypothetical protein [Thermoanaerobaculia bacterium]
MSFRLVVCTILFVLPVQLTLRAQNLPFRRVLITKVGETPLQSMADLAEDDRGFLWLGGAHGLYRYDGVSLEAFTNRPDDPASVIPGPYIQLQKSRRNDGLWLGSATSGLSFFNLSTEKAQNYVADPTDSAALAGNEVAGIYEDAEGGLWVGTNRFTLHYLFPQKKPGMPRRFRRFRPELPPDAPSDLITSGALGEIIPDVNDPDILWLGSRYGVYRFNRKDQSFRLFPFNRMVTYWYRPMNLQMFMDPGGFIWCGGFATGLCRLDPSTGAWIKVLKNKRSDGLLNANSIQDIIALDEQNLLVLTSVDDAWKVNWRQQSTEFLNIGVMQRTGNPFALSRAIRRRDGDFWILYNEGLIRLTSRPHLWGFVYFPGLLPKLMRSNWQRAYAISPDSQSLFIGTLRGDGLLIYDINRRRMTTFSYKTAQGPDETDVLMDALCFDADGRCWIGSDTGLLYLEQNAGNIRRFTGTSPLPPEFYHAQIASLAANEKYLWIGTRGNGMFRLDITKGTASRVQAAGLSDESSVLCLLKDSRGYLWAGHDQGLTVYDPATTNSWHFSRRHALPPGGLSNDYVTGLATDAAGHLWISSLGGGMLRLRHADPENPYFDAFYNNEVPGGNLIYEFTVCEHGKLWLGTQSGLAVLDTQTRAFVNYDNRDGMFAKIGAMIRLPDGRIVSGAHRGFHIFHPDTLVQSGEPPVPYLKRFRVFDKEMPLPFRVDETELLTLPHNQNHFSFELGAINFGENARNVFAYRLEGYDRDWVYSGARNYVSYTNLPAGSYTLRVKAANNHGVWSEREKTIRVLIRPPYWQTWWFVILILSALVVAGYGLFSAWRQRQRAKAAQNAVEYFTNADYRY